MYSEKGNIYIYCAIFIFIFTFGFIFISSKSYRVFSTNRIDKEVKQSSSVASSSAIVYKYSPAPSPTPILSSNKGYYVYQSSNYRFDMEYPIDWSVDGYLFYPPGIQKNTPYKEVKISERNISLDDKAKKYDTLEKYLLEAEGDSYSPPFILQKITPIETKTGEKGFLVAWKSSIPSENKIMYASYFELPHDIRRILVIYGYEGEYYDAYYKMVMSLSFHESQFLKQ